MKEKNILDKQKNKHKKRIKHVMEHINHRQTNIENLKIMYNHNTIYEWSYHKKQVLIQNSLKKKQKYNVQSKDNILTYAPKL